MVVDEAYGEEFEEFGEGDEDGVDVVEGHESVGEVVEVECDSCVREVKGTDEEEKGEDWEDWGSVEDDNCWIVERGEMEGVEEGFGIVNDFFEESEEGTGCGGRGRGNWDENKGGRWGRGRRLSDKDYWMGGCEVVKSSSMGESTRRMVGGSMSDD